MTNQIEKILSTIAAIVILVLSINTLSAQKDAKLYKDKLILKDGSVIVGHITAYDPEGVISLELSSGMPIMFQNNQVKKVIMGIDGSKGKSNDLSLKAKRIYNETQLSLLLGESGSGMSLSHNVLYQYNGRLAVGVGLGVENYYLSSGRDIYPLYANVKLNILKSSSAPFIGTKLGYGMAFKKESENIFEAQGGLMFNPYFGIRVGSRGLIINLYTGLKFQAAQYEIINSWETRSEEILFRRMEVGISVMF